MKMVIKKVDCHRWVLMCNNNGLYDVMDFRYYTDARSCFRQIKYGYRYIKGLNKRCFGDVAQSLLTQAFPNGN